MNTPIEEIKARLDIVELIQGYIRVQKAGSNFKANCPFHSEKTPSFFISPTRQMWHCFGCGAGGDAFTFVMKIEGHEFPEALKMLAERAGVKITREDPRLRSERNRLYDLNEETTKVFERSLSLTPAVGAYLKKRGVREETIREFRVGFAPQSWDFLTRALQERGFKRDEIEKAGLAVSRRQTETTREISRDIPRGPAFSQRESALGWYDRFRSRIMFPIADPNGRIIGFGGRIFQEESRIKNQESRDEAKYVNTPQTLLYDKSRVLYGFERAKQDIREKNQAVLVEGYMDCIMSHQAGVKNTVAVSGTALTPFQLQTLRRLTDTLVSSFDTDAAGESATKRSLELAAKFEFDRRVAVIPSGKDPADAVLENPAHWIQAVEEAKSVVDFYFAKGFERHNPRTSEGKKAISSLVLPWVRELSNEIEKAHWVSELSRRLEIPEEAIWKELKRGGGMHERFEQVKSEKPQAGTRRELLEDRLLILLPMVAEEKRVAELAEHHLVFTSPLREALFHALHTGVASAFTADVRQELDLLRFKGEVMVQLIKDPLDEFLLCKKELERESIKEKLVSLGAEIQNREKEGNAGLLEPLLQDFKKMSEKLKGLL